MNFNLNKDNWLKVLKGAAIAGAATALTYLSSQVTELDFGAATGVIVGVLSIAINYARKVLEENNSQG